MLVRIALTETSNAKGRNDAFAIAWPLDNDPRHTTAGAAEAIRRAVGGLPVVVVALDSRGDLHSFGDPRHSLALVDLGLEGHSWAHFEVDLRRISPELATPPSVLPPIAA